MTIIFNDCHQLQGDPPSNRVESFIIRFSYAMINVDLVRWLYQ